MGFRLVSSSLIGCSATDVISALGQSDASTHMKAGQRIHLTSFDYYDI